jgi:hypothetical protein
VLGAGVYTIGTMVHTKLDAADWLVLVLGGLGAAVFMAFAMRWWPAVRRDVHDLIEAFGVARRTRNKALDESSRRSV